MRCPDPECDALFDSKGAVKSHHKQVHGEKITDDDLPWWRV